MASVLTSNVEGRIESVVRMRDAVSICVKSDYAQKQDWKHKEQTMVAQEDGCAFLYEGSEWWHWLAVRIT